MTRPTRYLRGAASAFAFGLLSGCASFPAASPPASEATTETTVRHDDVTPRALLAYGRQAADMDEAAFARELKALAGKATDPTGQMRLALLHAQPRAEADAGRALQLLDRVLASRAPEAAALQALARIMHVQVSARVRLATQNEALLAERQAGRDAIANLQKKLDALTDIERSLPTPARPAPEIPR